ETPSDFGQVEDRRREHHPDRREMRERRLAERVVARAERRRADVTREHVRAPHGLAVAAEGARDRLLEKALAKADARLPGDDFHDVPRLARARPREKRAKQFSLWPDAARRGDRVERRHDVREAHAVASRRILTDELGRDVTEIRVSLV